MPVHTRERGSSPGFDGVKIKFYYYYYKWMINDVTLLKQTAIFGVTLYRATRIPFGNLAHNNIRLYTNVDKHMRSDKKVVISHFYMVIVR